MNIKAGDIFIDISDNEVYDIAICTRPHDDLPGEWWARWLAYNNEELYFDPSRPNYKKVDDDLASKLHLIFE